MLNDVQQTCSNDASAMSGPRTFTKPFHHSLSRRWTVIDAVLTSVLYTICRGDTFKELRELSADDGKFRDGVTTK